MMLNSSSRHFSQHFINQRTGSIVTSRITASRHNDTLTLSYIHSFFRRETLMTRMNVTAEVHRRRNSYSCEKSSGVGSREREGVYLQNFSRYSSHRLSSLTNFGRQMCSCVFALFPARELRHRGSVCRVTCECILYDDAANLAGQ